MNRAEPIAANPVASRLFAPILRDWQRPAELARILAENLGLMLVAIVASRWVAPDDPFGVTAQFPWIWLMPTLLALRYGTLDGVLASGLLLGAWLLPHPWGMSGPYAPQFPQAYFLGGLGLVLIAGQFADVWNGRLARIRAANAYLDERLVSLTRTHYLVRLSHQRLEQELLVRPVMLGDLLTELRPLTPEDAGRLANAEALLRLLASSCEIESARVHRLVDDALEADAVAVLGEPGPFDPDDPLVRLALESNSCMHVRAAEASTYRSRYLVCAPIRASDGSNLGMLLVETMPFFALNEENLQFIIVLLGYYADGLTRSRAIHRVLALRPSTPADFALELVRMKRLYDTAGIDSSLVVLSLGTRDADTSIYEHLRRSKRSTDLGWEIESSERRLIVLLMPMCGPAAVEGMLARIERSLRERFEVDFTRARIAVHTAGMSAAEAEWMLDDLLNRAGVRQDHTLPAGM